MGWGGQELRSPLQRGVGGEVQEKDPEVDPVQGRPSHEFLGGNGFPESMKLWSRRTRRGQAGDGAAGEGAGARGRLCRKERK